jgi:hypothetical protein
VLKVFSLPILRRYTSYRSRIQPRMAGNDFFLARITPNGRSNLASIPMSDFSQFQDIISSNFGPTVNIHQISIDFMDPFQRRWTFMPN